MIETKDLTRRFGARTAVEAINLSVPRGKVVGFLGPNGAGKSTTLKMLAAYLPPSEGSARVNGFDVVEESLSARRSIGYMPETVPLHPEMRVEEYLRFRGEIKGVRSREMAAAMDRAMQLADITEVRRRLVGDLSKGFRQRVGLADALIASPPLLILDEPTEGLDPNQILRFREVIRGLGAEHTVFLSTHILQEVEAVCESVIIIHQGRLVAQGAIDAVREDLEGGRSRVRLTLAPRSGREVDVESALREACDALEGVSAQEVTARGAQRVALVDLGTAGDDGLDALLDALAARGVGVRGVTQESSSLESVFHALTSAKAPADAAEATPEEA
ncbi:MAG: ABC transporter ATP-binding protein [Polyangiales bacterium]